VYNTYVSKLTLSVDGAVVERAKRYASKRGTSVSRLVEEYLELLSRPAPLEDEFITPRLRQLREDFKGVTLDVADYRKYLVRKYR
jgi:hypothetical protein